MKQIVIILSKLVNIAQNTAIWLKVLIFVIVCGATFTIGAYFSKVPKCEDCSEPKAQVQQLINALIEVRKGIKELAATSTQYIMDEPTLQYMYASYTDTIPQKKPTQVQVKAQVMVSKIDSIILDAQKKQVQQKSRN